MLLKRLYKAFKYTSISLISLLAILYFLLQTSWVQQWLAQRATAWLSEDMQTEVSIGKVRVVLLRSVVLEDLFIKDQTGDTLIYAGRMEALIKEISPSKMQIRLRNIEATDAIIHFEKHPGHKEWNYDFFIRYVDPPRKGPRKPGPDWKLVSEGLTANNCDFRYKNGNKEFETDRFDLNWVEMSNINARADEFKFENDTISFHILEAQMKEKCGLNVTGFNAAVSIHPRIIALHNFLIETPESRIGHELELTFSGYNDLGNFTDSVNLRTILDSAVISTNDLALFSPSVKQINTKFHISGRMKGKLPALRFKDLEVFYGKGSVLKGKGKLTGLPDVEQTLIDFKIKEAQTNAEDIELFAGKGSLPKEIRNLGNISYSGEFIGYYTDFVAFGEFSTGAGKGKTDINLKLGDADKNTAYSGYLELYQFNLGKFLGLPDSQVGSTTLSAKVDGTGLQLKTADADIDASVSYVDINGYRYKNGKIKGRFSQSKLNGSLVVDDPNLQLRASGIADLKAKTPRFSIDADIELARLGALSIDTVSSNLKAEIRADFTGDTPDKLNGELHITDLIYERGGQLFDYAQIDFSSYTGTNGIREISLKSPVADVSLVGYFDVEHLEGAIVNYLHEYFPDQFEQVAMEDKNEDFEADIHIKDPRIITNLFLPGFDGRNILLDIDFNSRNQHADISISAEYFAWDKYGLYVNQLNGELWNKNPQQVNADIKIASLTVLDSVFTGSLETTAELQRNNISSRLLLNDTAHDHASNIYSQVNFADQKFQVSFDSSSVKYQGLAFDIQPRGRILISKQYVEFDSLSLFNERQSIAINGFVNQTSDDDLRISITELQLAPLNPLLPLGFSYDGLVNGSFHFTRFSTTPLFTAALTVSSAQIAADTLGDISLSSTYDAPNHLLNLKAELTKGKLSGASLYGTILTDKQEDYLDLQFRASDASASLVYIFFADYLENVSGTISARGSVKGSFKQPRIEGELFLNQPQFTISYLKTTYRAMGSILLTENKINFLNVKLTDTRSGSAVLSGEIRHQLFSQFYLDLQLNEINSMQVLNTSPLDNATYFGTAYVTGRGSFTGPTDNIFMKIRARSEKNTRLYIPLNNPEEATTDDFIRFVDKTGQANNPYKVNLSGITMDFELEMTPSAEVQMIFDSQLGDVIKASGNGTIKLEISTLGEFKMYGTYIIERGSYTFTSMNLFAKPFQLRQGSRITWTGDPLNAQVDLEAVYSLRASTSALMSNVDPGASGGATGGATQASAKVPVEAIIYVKNKLFEPDIRFGVNVNTNDLPPDANLGLLNATIQQIQNNQQEAARQVVSLLVTGNFVPPSNVQSGGPSVSSGINSSVGDLISSQLSNWLSQIIPGWEVNMLIRPKDDIQQESQFITTLTTRWLNDRLIVEGSFDAENPYTPSGSIQYNLRKDGKLRGRAFSRAQSNPVLQQNVVTQGLSLMYRAEFDRIPIFGRKRRSQQIKDSTEQAKPVRK